MNAVPDQMNARSEGVVCPRCLLENPPMASFCMDCGAPIGRLATTDPFQATLSEGTAFRAAVEGPPRMIVLIGIWALFLPNVLIVPLFYTPLSQAGAGETVFQTLLALASAVIVFRCTRNYMIKTRAARERQAA